MPSTDRRKKKNSLVLSRWYHAGAVIFSADRNAHDLVLDGWKERPHGYGAIVISSDASGAPCQDARARYLHVMTASGDILVRSALPDVASGITPYHDDILWNASRDAKKETLLIDYVNCHATENGFCSGYAKDHQGHPAFWVVAFGQAAASIFSMAPGKLVVYGHHDPRYDNFVVSAARVPDDRDFHRQLQAFDPTPLGGAIEILLPARDHTRAWFRCRSCGMLAYQDHMLPRLSNPIADLPCQHGRAACESISADEALFYIAGRRHNVWQVELPTQSAPEPGPA